MFWQLALAHLVADYPLQTPWIVTAKRHLPGLFVHIGVHLAAMIVFCGSAWLLVWPYIFLLALIHFTIDYGKAYFSRCRPDLVVFPYIIDQLLHLISMVAISWWCEQLFRLDGLFPLTDTQAIYAVGYLSAGYVWFISERILFSGDDAYQHEVTRQFFPRMALRIGLLTLLLSFSQGWISHIMAGVLQILYLSDDYRRRAMVIDVTVAVVAWLGIRVALWFA